MEIHLDQNDLAEAIASIKMLLPEPNNQVKLDEKTLPSLID